MILTHFGFLIWPILGWGHYGKIEHMTGGVWGGLKDNVREVVFGLEDSLVSTLGTITGVAVGTHDPFVVMLTGVVLVFVEAISMAAGSYLSSKSASDLYENRAKQDDTRVLMERVSDRESLAEMFGRKGFTKSETEIAVQAIGRERKLWLKEVRRNEYRFAPAVSPSPIFAGFVMGAFYLVGGFFTFAPYAFVPIDVAIPSAIAFTVAALFLVGILKGRLTGTSPIRSGVEMLVVSSSAALIGFALGRIVPMLFHSSPIL